MAESLLFAFPVDETEDGVRFYLTNDDPIPGSNVIETYYRLDIQYQGAVESFRLPHDMERLWTRLNPSTPTEEITYGPDPRLGFTVSGPTEEFMSSLETSEDPTSD